MPWQLARRKENHVEAERGVCEFRVAHEVILRGADYALPVDGAERLRLDSSTLARLDLDEYRHTETARDEVDLADRRLEAPLDDSIELELQEQRGECFTSVAEGFGRKPPAPRL